MKNHEWELYTFKDPIDHRYFMSIYCRECDSGLFRHIPVGTDLSSIAGSGNPLKSAMMKFVESRFASDCDEARAINTIENITNS